MYCNENITGAVCVVEGMEGERVEVGEVVRRLRIQVRNDN